MFKFTANMKHKIQILAIALPAAFLMAGCATADQNSLSPQELADCRQEFLQKSQAEQEAYLNSPHANWNCVPQNYTDGGQGEEDPEAPDVIKDSGYLGNPDTIFPKP